MKLTRSSALLLLVLIPCLCFGLWMFYSQTTSSGSRLLNAARTGDLPEIKRLIAGGANVNIVNNDGMTPLMVALVEKQGDIALELIKAGANVNATDAGGQAVLMYAMRTASKKDAIVYEMLNRGANANCKDHTGNTPLHMLCAGRYSPRAKVNVQMLVDKNADVNAKNDKGETPLILAAEWRHPSEVLYLLSKGADASVQDKTDYTPLMATALADGDRIAIAQAMIAKGVDVRRRDNTGKDALAYAKRWKNKRIVALLEQQMK